MPSLRAAWMTAGVGVILLAAGTIVMRAVPAGSQIYAVVLLGFGLGADVRAILEFRAARSAESKEHP